MTPWPTPKNWVKAQQNDCTRNRSLSLLLYTTLFSGASYTILSCYAAWYIYFLQLTTDWTKEEKYGQLVMHCTALLVDFWHECPVMFDPAGFPGTLGRPVDCRDATGVRLPRQLSYLNFAKWSAAAMVWLSCLPKIYRGGPAVTMTDNESFFLTKFFLFCCKSRNCKKLTWV